MELFFYYITGFIMGCSLSAAVLWYYFNKKFEKCRRDSREVLKLFTQATERMNITYNDATSYMLKHE